MTKQRPATTRPPKSKSAKAKPAKGGVDPTPAKTLIDFTERGFDALRDRRLSAAGGAAARRDKKGQAFAEAVERLKADYGRVLKRPASSLVKGRTQDPGARKA